MGVAHEAARADPLVAATHRLWAGVAAQPAAPPDVGITMGQEQGLNAYGQGEHLYNFFGWGNPGTEQGQSARRMQPRASLMLPHAMHLGDQLTLAITMCGCGSTEPVRLGINGHWHEIALTETWQTTRLSVPTTPTMYERSIYIEWQSKAAPRPLVHAVVLEAHRAHGWLSSALVAALTILGVLLLGRAQPFAHRLSWSLVLLVSLLLGSWWYAPQLLPPTALMALAALAALALTATVAPLWQRICLWLLCLWLLALPQLLGTWVLDDAFISFRYAKNLIEGGGFTFNPGGELVEGYTNFLWTIIMAAALAVGLEPVMTAQWLCSGIAITTLLVSYHLARAWWPNRPWVLLPPLILAFNPSFLLYTARGSGMETALVTLLSLLALWALWRPSTRGPS
ncbi:MAG: hypothetical protein HC837_17785 [Chloroflexaceae bacterium]|nr:hypothetical protein [Chloroflexaceae bacterium]